MLANAQLLHPQLDRHYVCLVSLLFSTHEMSHNTMNFISLMHDNYCTEFIFEILLVNASWANTTTEWQTELEERMNLHRTTIPQQLNGTISV